MNITQNIAHWPATTVNEFFGALPWRGEHQGLVADAMPVFVDYRRLSVQDFFASIAWAGIATGGIASVGNEQALSYQMAVGKFFNCFAWQGKPNVGVVPTFQPIQAPSSDFNLNDLSDLF
jgi:hypothetical protein